MTASDPRQVMTELVCEYVNRALQLSAQGIASNVDIDTAMRLGCGVQHGPLEMLDRLGLDEVHRVLTGLQAATGDSVYRPAPLLEQLIGAGRLGRRVGAGVLDWDEDGAPVWPAHRCGPQADEHGIRRIAVVGSGLMARGITQTIATAGLPVVIIGRNDARAGWARAEIGRALDRLVTRGRMAPSASADALQLITAAGSLTGTRDCDLVIEAVVEDSEVKGTIFAGLGKVCPTSTMLASTTSSLSIAACAQAAGRPEQVVGMHFFNPAPVMRLVELAHTTATSQTTLARIRALCHRLGKTTVECPDRPGFIVNYLLFPYLARALDRLGAGIDDVVAQVPSGRSGFVDLDEAARENFGFPMGPCTLLDVVGLDVSLAIQQRLHATFGGPEFTPSPLLGRLVANGWLGRKNNRGLLTADVG